MSSSTRREALVGSAVALAAVAFPSAFAKERSATLKPSYKDERSYPILRGPILVCRETQNSEPMPLSQEAVDSYKVYMQFREMWLQLEPFDKYGNAPHRRCARRLMRYVRAVSYETHDTPFTKSDGELAMFNSQEWKILRLKPVLCSYPDCVAEATETVVHRYLPEPKRFRCAAHGFNGFGAKPLWQEQVRINWICSADSDCLKDA
jgi:hypothetical protein